MNTKYKQNTLQKNYLSFADHHHSGFDDQNAAIKFRKRKLTAGHERENDIVIQNHTTKKKLRSYHHPIDRNQKKCVAKGRTNPTTIRAGYIHLSN